jgi:hypothetical protein
MSKMDALRAMREARYEQAAARSTKAAPKRPTALLPTAVSVPAEAQGSTEALCGHRAISGRTCTRESGHAAKSHRYA